MALFTLEWHGDDFFATAKEVNKAAMTKAANLVSKYAKEHMTLQGTYDKRIAGGQSNPNVMHWSASPGEPPAVDTGILRASLVAEVTDVAFGVMGRVGPDIAKIKADEGKRKRKKGETDVEYGLYLELGTRKMAPRPFLRPALRANINKIQRIFRKANK